MATLTERDEQLLKWLADVRLADIESVRVMLGALSESGQVPSLRRAQQVVARWEKAGVVRRARPRLRGGSVVWTTPTFSGKREPNIYGVNAVHDIGVAAQTAYLIARGASFELDTRVDDATGRQHKGAHQADGIITTPQGHRVLLEVELTPKTAADRYRGIFADHVRRLQSGEVSQVFYYATAIAERALRRAIEGTSNPPRQGLVPPSLVDRFKVWPAFDPHHEHEQVVAARSSRGREGTTR